MSDENRPARRYRQFRCSDVLWEVFEEMAADRDLSADDLIDEAMRAFAHAQGYGVPGNASRYDGIQTPVRLTPPTFEQAPPAAAVAFPGSGRPPPPVVAPPGALYLCYAGATVLVDKEQFVIGRGARHSDLAIDDPDVSRRHAAIVRRENGFYINDLGSTNGIAYRGMRIDHKRIEEGDVFHICNHEIRFTYRP
jgi:FHA domain-containing protein